MFKRLARLSVSVMVLALWAIAAQPAAQAQPTAAFVVDLAINEADTNPGDGICLTAPSAKCSLRAAVQESNLLAGHDTITFAITGTLSLTSTLAITDSVTITGPGADQLTWYHNFNSFTSTVYFSRSAGQFYLAGVSLVGNGTVGGMLIQDGSLTLNEVVVHTMQSPSDLAIFSPTSNVTIIGSTFRNNNSPAGGAIYNQDGILTLIDSTLSQNGTGFGGAGLFNTGQATIVNSSVISNSTGGGAVGGRGAGIYNAGHMTIANSTIAGNQARFRVTSDGGGISNFGTLTLTSSTLSNNLSELGQGGGLHVLSGTVTLRNTIIANSTTGGDCSVVGGMLINGGNNLIEDNSCGFTGGADPLLGPLADNGGPTWTLALLPGSPAIDAGQAAGCQGVTAGNLAWDQRGYFRHADGDGNGSLVCDLGAYEYSAALPTHWLYVPFARR